jgi:hypothetical protein
MPSDGAREERPSEALPDAGRGAGLLFLMAAAIFCLRRLNAFDVFWYLRTGEEILRRHALLLTDPFSYTSAGPWTNHEWLAEICIALVHRAGGVAALVVFQAAAIVAALAILMRGHWPSAHVERWPAWLGLLCATVTLGLSAEPRAQLMSWILFAATGSLCFSDLARPSWRLAWALPIGVLWANIHGGNPTGVALLGILFLAAPSRRRALVTAGAALATLASPYGLRVHGHFLGAHGSLPEIREWYPLVETLAMGSIPQWAAMLSVLVASAFLVLRYRRRESIRFEAMALLVFFAIAARYARFTWELSILSAASLLRSSSLRPWRPSPARRVLGLGIALGLLVLASATAAQPVGLGLNTNRIPVGAVTFLRNNQPPGPMLNSYNFGGYLMWAYPREKVFIDGRAFTIYSEAHFRDLLRLYEEPPFFRELERRWRFRLAVLQRAGRGAEFVVWLRSQPDWQVLYEDGMAIILGKR